MTQESKFNEFFEELGGIENLKLMVNMGDIMYGEENGFPEMYFTLGWKNRAHFRVIGRNYSQGHSNYTCIYYIYIDKEETPYLMRRERIRVQMPILIKHHTGNEIFLFC